MLNGKFIEDNTIPSEKLIGGGGGGTVAQKNIIFVDNSVSEVPLSIRATISLAIADIYEEDTGITAPTASTFAFPDDGRVNDYWAGGVITIGGVGYAIVSSTSVLITISGTHASETGAATKSKAALNNKYVIQVNNPIDASSFVLPKNVEALSENFTQLTGVVTIKDSDSVFVGLNANVFTGLPTLTNFHIKDAGQVVIANDATHGTNGQALLDRLFFDTSCQGILNSSTGFRGTARDCFFQGSGKATATNKIIESGTLALIFVECTLLDSYYELSNSISPNVKSFIRCEFLALASKPYFLFSGSVVNNFLFQRGNLTNIEIETLTGTGGQVAVDHIFYGSITIPATSAMLTAFTFTASEAFAGPFIIDLSSTKSVISSAKPPFNIVKASAPIANDDQANTAGNGYFQVGSTWLDSSASDSYTLVFVSTGAANCKQTTP